MKKKKKSAKKNNEQKMSGNVRKWLMRHTLGFKLVVAGLG